MSINNILPVFHLFIYLGQAHSSEISHQKIEKSFESIVLLIFFL